MPPPLCASCGNGKRRTKLLKCLHSVCVGCVESHLTSLNEVVCPACRERTPSSGKGKPQLLALPEICSCNHDGGLEAEKVQRLCDECGDDALAEAQCCDCKATLCEGHAKMHAKSRTTLNHQIKPLNQISSAPSPCPGSSESTMRCIIHPTYQLKSYCVTCQELLCEKCLTGEQACNKGRTPHTLLSVGEAAQRMRRSVRQKLTDSADISQESVITKAIEDLGAVISQLHDRTEVVSEEVVEYFSTVSKLLKAREAAILEKLDRLRSAKLLPLEQQKQRLQESVSLQATVCMLLTSCHDDCDFVRMAGWLEETACEAIKSASNDCDLRPVAASNLIFRKENADLLDNAIARVADVIDFANIDTNQSRLDSPPSVCLGEELTISLKAATDSSQAVIGDDVTVTSLQVEVTTPDSLTVSCAASPLDDTGTFAARYKPITSGQHKVMAKFGDNHFTGSPTVVTVYERGFDPARCDSNIELSNHRMTARSVDVTDFRSVCGSAVYQSGTIDIRIRLDNMSSSSVMIFMCNSHSPSLTGYQMGRSAFGWYGKDAKPRNYGGTALGQPWQAGDVIHLSLDCDRHTLTGQHGRTATTETLSGVTGDLYLYVSLFSAGQQVSIL